MKKKILKLILSIVICLSVSVPVQYFYWVPKFYKMALKNEEDARQDLRKTVSMYNTAVLPRNISGGPWLVVFKFDSATNTINVHQYYEKN